jgi:hypothetical protein
MPAGGVIAQLTEKYGGNVHDKGAIEISGSSISRYDSVHRNATDLGNKSSFFLSEDKPDQRICWDFKVLRIAPTHYTIQTANADLNCAHLKS